MNRFLKLIFSVKGSLLLVFILVAVLYGIGLSVTGGDPVLLSRKLDSMGFALMIWRVFVYTGITLFFFMTRNRHRALGNHAVVQRLHKTGWSALGLISFIELSNLMRYLHQISSGEAL